jgi:mannose-6-phosphate isomerase-like protein (cupin superfamily)
MSLKALLKIRSTLAAAALAGLTVVQASASNASVNWKWVASWTTAAQGVLSRQPGSPSPDLEFAGWFWTTPLLKPINFMPKTNPKELNFPKWSETTKNGINTLKAGDTVKLHFHDANGYWIIIQGRGIATSEGITYELGPGDMLLTKAGDEHSLIVTEEMVAVYYYGAMPAGGRFWVPLQRHRSRFCRVARAEPTRLETTLISLSGRS